VLRAFPDAYWRVGIYGGGVNFRGELWRGWHRWWRFVLPLAAVVSLAIAAAPASGAKSEHTVRVMTRNLYLGADLTPALQATTFSQLTDAAGEIFNQVKQNNFPLRAKGLAKEILKTSPDLIGLQEAALWRTSPTCMLFVPPGPYTATHVAYDYVKLLLARLNKGQTRYRVVAMEPEFDFEAEANTNGGPPGSCNEDVRLTMRDAIFARVDDGVQVKNVKTGHYKTLFAPKLLGLITVPVDRGWISVDVKVRGGHWFRFIDTHLESYDDQANTPTNQGTEVGNGQIREAQAEELIQKGGPATGELPVILVGDLNSDTRTPLKPGDQLADQALLNAGFLERSTYKPLSCCLDADVLTFPAGGGKASQFNHKVDHIMTNDPKQIRLVSSTITGRQPVNGFWDSDHAGTFSVLTLP
jgi:endonuclease/exonuclease/phosphatase family metal-dependent hydrolase